MKLQIEDLKDKIVRTVEENKATIISGKTGSGKSTRVPMYLAEAGYRVIVTEPTVLSTISLAQNLSKNKVGFHTGPRSNFSSESKVIFMTEKLELIRLLAGIEELTNTVIIIDEVHEKTKDCEVLLALLKKLINEKPMVKLVVMSATMETEGFSRYLYNAPIIEIPSKGYSVIVFKRRADELEELLYKYIRHGMNTLVFLPGKKEISYWYEKLSLRCKKEKERACIFKLHSEVPEEEKEKIFERCFGTKIILATNIAETGMNMRDLDSIIDTGLKNEMEYTNGIPTLVTKQISKAERIQRLGRIGRFSPGVYNEVSDFKYEHREEYSKPHIWRESLEDILLILIRFNIDIKSLEFYNKPESRDIENGLEILKRLGAINERGEITEIGTKMSEIPLNPRAARMVVEAEKYEKDKSDVLIASLIMEFGYISENANRNDDCKESDLINEVECFKEIYNTPYARNSMKLKKILECINKILPIIGLKELSKGKTNISTIKKCLLCGYSDYLFVYKKGVGYQNKPDSDAYSMYTSSSLFKSRKRLVIASPIKVVEISGKTYCRISCPTSYTLNELLEYGDEIFTEVYFLADGKIYKKFEYNGIEIVSLLLGTIGEVKESDPSEFYEEVEYNAKFRKTYVSLYYKGLKLSSHVR